MSEIDKIRGMIEDPGLDWSRVMNDAAIEASTRSTSTHGAYRRALNLAVTQPHRLGELYGAVPPSQVDYRPIREAYDHVLGAYDTADADLRGDPQGFAEYVIDMADSWGVSAAAREELITAAGHPAGAWTTPTGLAAQIRTHKAARDALVGLLGTLREVTADPSPEAVQAAMTALYARQVESESPDSGAGSFDPAKVAEARVEQIAEASEAVGRATDDGEIAEEIDYFTTGIERIDEALVGLYAGGVTMLGGATGSGKSTIALYLLRQAIEQGWRSAYLLLEMTPPELTDRALLSWHPTLEPTSAAIMSHGGLAVSDMLRRRAFGSADYAREVLSPGLDYLRETAPWWTIEAPARKWALADVVWRLRWLARRGVRFVVLDYLQLLDLGEDRWKALENAAEAIKSEAKALGLHVLLLVQINGSRHDRPSLQNMRESKGMANPLDNAIFLWHPKPRPGEPAYRGHVELLVDKARSGTLGVTASVTMIGELYRIDPRHPYAVWS